MGQRPAVRGQSHHRLSGAAARWLEESWGHVNGRCEHPLVGASAEWLTLSNLYEWLCSPRFVAVHEVFLRDDTGRGSRPATSARDVSEQLSRGSTLQVRHLESFLPRSHPVMELASDIEGVTGEAVEGISVFVTPAGTQALPAHSDGSDVVAVQLSGAKTWTLGGSEFTLTPGRFAYIPAGQVHEVRQDGDDLSVSLAYIMGEDRLADALHAHLHGILRDLPGATALIRRGGAEMGDEQAIEIRSLDAVCARMADQEALRQVVARHARGRQLPTWPDDTLWDPAHEADPPRSVRQADGDA